MEAALWSALENLVPEICLTELQALKSPAGVLELSGRISISHATRFNIAVHRFLRQDSARFGLSGKIQRKGLEIYLPKVRLGDITTEREREVLAAHTENRNYLDPESLVDAPEWNADFVRASDRRHKAHIKPRYAQDDAATVEAVASFIAEFCRLGDGVVVHSGAGLSAAAGIATYREGSSESVAISAAMPTYSHYAIVALNKLGLVDYVCSQNVDGLHRRSGLTASALSELHGNMYIETCSCCSPPMEYVRPYDVYSTPCTRPTYWARYVETIKGQEIESNTSLTRNERSSGIHHITGRACPQGGGPLRDSVIHFGESLPVHALEEGERRSTKAPLNLVIGCSLLVQPAASLPFEGKGPVAIVALTCTGSDIKALRRGGVLLHAPADVAMERLVHHLDLHFPNSPELMETLHQRVQARDRAVLRSDSNCPYDGGADGGVVPTSLLARVELAPQVPMEALPAPVQQTKALCLRQVHEVAEEGWHRWSLSLESEGGNAKDMSEVQAVRFQLHPTFDPPEYCLSKPPFTVGPFLGWGTFTVKVHIERQGLPTTRVCFPLDFGCVEKVVQVAP